MATSAFGNAIEFMQRLGIFDVVLPFLLVFTMVFAFLEKTKVFGVEKFKTDDGKYHDLPRKNINSIVAFVIAFFVVASTQLVALISEITSKIVLLLVLIFSFMLTVGAMYKEKAGEGFELSKGWKSTFAGIFFVAIAAIFLDALNWLTPIFSFLSGFWDSDVTAAAILMIVLVGFIFFIQKDPKSEKEDKKGD